MNVLWPVSQQYPYCSSWVCWLLLPSPLFTQMVSVFLWVTSAIHSCFVPLACHVSSGMSGVFSITSSGLDTGSSSGAQKDTNSRMACMALVTGPVDSTPCCCKYAFHFCKSDVCHSRKEVGQKALFWICYFFYSYWSRSSSQFHLLQSFVSGQQLLLPYRQVFYPSTIGTRILLEWSGQVVSSVAPICSCYGLGKL